MKIQWLETEDGMTFPNPEVNLSKLSLEKSLDIRENALSYLETVLEEDNPSLIEQAIEIIGKRPDMDKLAKLKKKELQFVVDAAFDSTVANKAYEDKNNPYRDLLIYTMDSGAVSFACAKLKLYKS